MKGLILAAVVVLGLAGCASAPTQAELSGADYGPYPDNYKEIISGYMGRTLKDPDSARYEFLNAPATGWSGFGAKKYGYIVCAYVNAKNSFGGYVGNRLNYFMIRNGAVIDATHGDGEYIEAMARGRCQKFAPV